MTEELKEIVIGTGYIRAFFESDPDFETIKKDEKGNVLEGKYKEVPLKVDVDRIAEFVDEEELLSSEELKEMGIDLIILGNPRVKLFAYKRDDVLYMVVDDNAFNEFLGSLV